MALMPWHLRVGDTAGADVRDLRRTAVNQPQPKYQYARHD